jgi:hypothetical protein
MVAGLWKDAAEVGCDGFDWCAAGASCWIHHQAFAWKQNVSFQGFVFD